MMSEWDGYGEWGVTTLKTSLVPLRVMRKGMRGGRYFLLDSKANSIVLDITGIT